MITMITIDAILIMTDIALTTLTILIILTNN
jgi:hypothetical protein